MLKVTLSDDLFNALRAEAHVRLLTVDALVAQIVKRRVDATRDELTDLIGKAACVRFASTLAALAES